MTITSSSPLAGLEEQPDAASHTHQLKTKYDADSNRYDHVPPDFDIATFTNRYLAWYPYPDGDPSPAAEAAREHRKANAWQITSDYYDLVSTSYETGWGQAFHFSPIRRGMSVARAHVEHEKMVGELLGLKPGMKVLDVGCGVGAPSRTMARCFGVEVTGITSCQWHVDRGAELSAEAGLADKVKAVLGDFHKMPFADSTFDAAFDFESLCHAVDIDTAHAELARVLKPGAPLAIHDWMLTPAYSRATHLALRDRIERCNGLATLHTAAEVRASLARCGFAVEREEDFEARGAAGLPWWYPVVGRWWRAQAWGDFVLAWRMGAVHLAWEACVVRAMVAVGRWPGEVLRCMDVMRNCPWSVAQGSREGIFTPIQHFLARNGKEDEMKETGENVRSDI